MIKKILFDFEGNKYYWEKGNLDTKNGQIKESELKKNKDKVKSNKNRDFFMMKANFLDQVEKIKRGPAIMLPKDIGLILVYANISKNSVVLEAGSGSGMLTIYLARAAKKVYSYELKEDFHKLAKKNLETLKIKNAVLKNKDIFEGIDEKNLDALILDMLEPWRAVENCKKALKESGYLVVYVTNINQLTMLMQNKSKLYVEKIVELLERTWIFDKQRTRPNSNIIGHTGFLVFLRK